MSNNNVGFKLADQTGRPESQADTAQANQDRARVVDVRQWMHVGSVQLAELLGHHDHILAPRPGHTGGQYCDCGSGVMR